MTMTIISIILAVLGIAAIVLNIVGKKHVATMPASPNPVLVFMAKKGILWAGVAIIIGAAVLFSVRYIGPANTTAVSLTAPTASVEIGKTVDILDDVNGITANDITWEPDNNNATVDNGIVTGVSAGTTTITAKVYGIKLASCVVTVTEANAPASETPAASEAPADDEDETTDTEELSPEDAEFAEANAAEIELITSSMKTGMTDEEAVYYLSYKNADEEAVDKIVEMARNRLNPQDVNPDTDARELAGMLLMDVEVKNTLTDEQKSENVLPYSIEEFGTGLGRMVPIDKIDNLQMGENGAVIWADKFPSITAAGNTYSLSDKSVIVIHPDTVVSFDFGGELAGWQAHYDNPNMKPDEWEDLALWEAVIAQFGQNGWTDEVKKYRLTAEGVLEEINHKEITMGEEAPGEWTQVGTGKKELKLMVPERFIGEETTRSFKGVGHFNKNDNISIILDDGSVYDINTSTFVEGKDENGYVIKTDPNPPEGVREIALSWTGWDGKRDPILGIKTDQNEEIVVRFYKGATVFWAFNGSTFKYTD